MRLSFLVAISLVVTNLYLNHERPTPRSPEPQVLDDHAALLAPIQLDGLTLVPIVERTPTSADDVLVLDEAMARRLVAIHELDDGQVNTLELVNRAELPLFVLAGEVIIGGKQDRIIAANTVIPPRTTQLVPVFCVERGRWTGSTADFATAGVLAHSRLRGKASYEGQHDVWEEVHTANTLRSTTSATDTYRTLAATQRDGTLAHWETRANAALDALPDADRTRMIGYAIALDGKVVGIDMFASPALFAKLERKLVRSYLADAADLPEPGRVTPLTVAAIRAFMADADGAVPVQSFETTLSATRIKRGALTGNSSVELKSGRHLYSNYLGNVRMSETPRVVYPSYLDHPDRHLYPGYIGNYSSYRATPQPPTADPPRRLRRTDD